MVSGTISVNEFGKRLSILALFSMSGWQQYWKRHLFYIKHCNIN